MALLRSHLELGRCLGIAMYEDCAEQAQRSGDDDLADLVLMHRALAEVMANQAVPEDRLERFADRARTDPRFAILSNAITREREVAQRQWTR